MPRNNYPQRGKWRFPTLQQSLLIATVILALVTLYYWLYQRAEMRVASLPQIVSALAAGKIKARGEVVCVLRTRGTVNRWNQQKQEYNRLPHAKYYTYKTIKMLCQPLSFLARWSKHSHLARKESLRDGEFSSRKPGFFFLVQVFFLHKKKDAGEGI